MPIAQVALLALLLVPSIAYGHNNAIKPCGTITKSLTLKHDCYGPMIIAGDNITVNLNGRSVKPGGLVDVDYRGGVEIFDRRGVTIKNGTIDGYDYGLLVLGGGGHIFRNLAIARGGAEEPENQVLIQDVDHTVVKRVTVTRFFDRVPFRFIGTQSEISHVRSRGYASVGAFISGDGLLIAHNEFGSEFGDESSCGLLFSGNRSTVRRNYLTTEDTDPRGGALCVSGRGNVITSNTALGAATGMILDSNAADNVIKNNYIRSNPASVSEAIDIRGGTNACGNTWKSNNFETDSEGDGPDEGCIR